MTAPDSHTIREANRLVLELAASALPARGSLDTPFAIDVEGEDMRWFGVVRGERPNGVVLFLRRGTAGLRALYALADDVGDERARVRSIDAFVTPRAALEPRRRSALERAGVRTELVADIASGTGDRPEGMPDRAELRRFLLVVRALLAAVPNETFPAPLPAGRLHVLSIRGDARAPSIEITVEDEPDDARRPPPRAADVLREWETDDGDWIVVTFSDPAEGAIPALTEFLVVDAAKHTLVGRFDVASAAPLDTAREFLRGTWFDETVEDGYLASRIAFADAEVAELVRVPLAELGAACTTIDRAAAEREALRTLRLESRTLKDHVLDLILGGAGAGDPFADGYEDDDEEDEFGDDTDGDDSDEDEESDAPGDDDPPGGPGFRLLK